jgi:hypothetical protein
VLNQVKNNKNQIIITMRIGDRDGKTPMSERRLVSTLIELVDKFPNDAELGARVRILIGLYNK